MTLLSHMKTIGHGRRNTLALLSACHDIKRMGTFSCILGLNKGKLETVRIVSAHNKLQSACSQGEESKIRRKEVSND